MTSHWDRVSLAEPAKKNRSKWVNDQWLKEENMLIKKDYNAELEKVIEQKDINEQAKNLLQGILYKIEVSYKDYQKVKAKKKTEEKYIEELIDDIHKRCNKISVVKLSQKIADNEIQKQLVEKKFYVGEEIVSYPIEEKILYAIEKKARYPKILNNKYEDVTIALSAMINEGKNMDRTEALRDFNGWSWTTINKEIENIEANLVYQTLQILLGEEFLDNWCKDKDGIIDYLEQFLEEIAPQYGEEIANKIQELLCQIALANTIKVNSKFAESIDEKIQILTEKIEKFDNTQQKIVEISNNKKQLLQELKEIEKIIGQDIKLKEQYQKTNEEAPIDKKIFSIRVFKNQLDNRKKEILEKIDKCNYLLNPSNYIEEKNKIVMQKQKLEEIYFNQEQVEKLLIEFVKNFLECLYILIKNEKNEEEILDLIYKFRYFMLLSFNLQKSIKDVQELQKSILKVEKKLVEKAIQKKVISNVPFEIMRHLFETRIIILEDLFYKITAKDEKYYVQIFDENIKEEKFEITPIENTKLNKKIKIFI